MKKYLIGFSLLIVIGLLIVFKTYNKPHENMTNAKSEHSLSAADLFSAYQTNEEEANAKYLDKVVTVVGNVKETTEENGTVSVMLDSDDMMFGIRCQLDDLTTHKRKAFPVGEKISFKGKCTGSLMDVVLVRCVEI